MPDLRKDPVIGRWVIIATERGRRPSEFFQQPHQLSGAFCPLCEGNEDKTPPEVFAIRRDNSLPNAPGWHCRVVSNKFPALRIEGEPHRENNDIYEWMNGIGAHEVIIETPLHDVTLSSLSPEAVVNVLLAYRERMIDLSRDDRFQYLMVFKNHGNDAGASLEHSHSQLVALPIVPKRVQEEFDGARTYYESHGTCVFCDVIKDELSQRKRVIAQNDKMIALAPFAARFPFETWILPKRHASYYTRMTPDEMPYLAFLLLDILRRMDRVLSCPPYNYVLHTDSPRNGNGDSYHWHIEIMPKLTRIAGFEWGTGFYINPTPPEDAARFLTEVSPEEREVIHGP